MGVCCRGASQGRTAWPPPSSHDSWAWPPGWVTLGTSLSLSYPPPLHNGLSAARDVPDRRRPLRRLPEPLSRRPPPGRPPDTRKAGPRRRPRAEHTPGACPPLRTSHPGLPGVRTSGGPATGCRTLSVAPKVRGRRRLAGSLRSTPVRTRQRCRASASGRQPEVRAEGGGATTGHVPNGAALPESRPCRRGPRLPQRVLSGPCPPSRSRPRRTRHGHGLAALGFIAARRSAAR